jgi:hypothetical protein
MLARLKTCVHHVILDFGLSFRDFLEPDNLTDRFDDGDTHATHLLDIFHKVLAIGGTINIIGVGESDVVEECHLSNGLCYKDQKKGRVRYLFFDGRTIQ